jgi:hypothetical protein
MGMNNRTIPLKVLVLPSVHGQGTAEVFVYLTVPSKYKEIVLESQCKSTTIHKVLYEINKHVLVFSILMTPCPASYPTDVACYLCSMLLLFFVISTLLSLYAYLPSSTCDLFSLQYAVFFAIMSYIVNTHATFVSYLQTSINGMISFVVCYHIVIMTEATSINIPFSFLSCIKHSPNFSLWCVTVNFVMIS